jgi:quinol monooxygenase YgiN
MSILLLSMMFTPGANLQTSNAAFYVATYIDVQTNSTSQGVALIRQYREASRAEGGNLRVDAVQEISRPNRFVIIEAWKDQQSFEAHEKAEPTSQFRARLKAIHNSPYDQRVHLGFTVGPAAPASGRDTVSAVTHVDVPPPRREETEVLLKRLAEESRKDDGNVRYDVFQQTPARTNHFTVFAAWKDAKAFDSHEMKPHTRQFREALGPMLGALYDERLYKPLN